MALSVIIPVKDSEENWRTILNDLTGLQGEDEILVVSPSAMGDEVAAAARAANLPCPCRFVNSDMGRGKQLNAGARAAISEDLWFLHCDSRLAESCVAVLKAGLARAPRAVLYFDLAFQSDGPKMMFANAWGAWIRSHVLRLPFGDQAFAVRKDLFLELGGFTESAPYGEDHLFVWRAHEQGVAVLPLPAKIRTSARKYMTRGWVKTTALHVYLTVAQAAPEAIKVFQSKVARWIG